MKATTTKKILIGAVAALCVTTIAGVTALAVYTNRQLNAENTLTVGKEVDTVVISGGKNYEKPLYPGDSATFTYNIDLTGHTADDVTISWELKNENESNVDSDFTVTAMQTEAVPENGAVEGGSITITVKMSERESAPEYNTVTLSVLLTVAGE